MATKRNEAFEWIRAVQQGAILRSTLEKELGHVIELDKLLKGIRNGPSPQRKKAMAVLSLERGIKCSLVRSFLHLSRKSLRSYWERYRHGSTIALFAKRMNGPKNLKTIESDKPSLHCSTHRHQYTGSIERLGR